MRAIAFACGLAILSCHNLVLAQDSSSAAPAAAAQGNSNQQTTNQIDSVYSAPFGPISISAGPATQGGFGISVSGNKSTGPLARLYSNLPTETGPDARYQAYVASLIYQVNGFTTVPTLFEQNQLVGVAGRFRTVHGERKQLIERSFLEQGQAQNL